MLDAPAQSFGIHNIYFEDLLDPTYSAIAKIIGSAEIDQKPEQIDNTGGDSVVPFASAPGKSASEIPIVIKQFDKQLTRFLTPFDSASVVETAAGESGGSVSAIANLVGTSAVDATTGIASVAVGTAADLRPGRYRVIATGSATVDLYVDTDVSGGVEYQNSDLKINSASITIPGTSATVESEGIEFTGGSGTVALVTGDVAYFDVLPISTYLLETYFGKPGACQREFRMKIVSKCLSGQVRMTEFPRCVGSANMLPNYLEDEFSTMEASIKVLRPTDVDYYAKTTYINK